jgi:hypothetical protein
MFKPFALRCGHPGPLPPRLKAAQLRLCGRPPKPRCAVIHAAAASAGDDAAADWSGDSQDAGGGGGSPKRGPGRQPVEGAVAGKIMDLKRRLRMAERKLEVRGSVLVARWQRRAAVEQRRATAALIQSLAFCRRSPPFAACLPQPQLEPSAMSHAPCLPPLPSCRRSRSGRRRCSPTEWQPPSVVSWAARATLRPCGGQSCRPRGTRPGEIGRHWGCASHAAAEYAKRQLARMRIATLRPPGHPPTHPLVTPLLPQAPRGDSGRARPGEGQPGSPGALWVPLPRSAFCAPGL